MSDERVLFTEIEKDSRNMLKKKITSYFFDKVFNTKDAEWMNTQLSDILLNELKNISPNFKYCLSLVLLQNDSCDFNQNINLYYDAETDGCISEKYTFDNIVCVFTLFCLAL